MCMEAVTGEAPALGMPCGHVFHSDCAGTWLAEHDTCPTCRFRLGGPGAWDGRAEGVGWGKCGAAKERTR